MKQLIWLALVLLSINTYPQTSIKSQPYSATTIDRFLWGYSKNKMVSEKPLIDFDVMDNWKGLGRYLSVSDDGQYFAYTINKMEFNEFRIGLLGIDSLVVQSTKNGKRNVFTGIEPGYFSADSRQYIFQDGEVLCFLQLGSAQMRKIENLASFKIAQDKWLAYQLKDKEGLTLQNILTGKERQFAAVADYSFSANGEWLICQSKETELALYNLASGTEMKFSSVDRYLLSKNGTVLLLKTAKGDKKELHFVTLPTGDAKVIWFGMDKENVVNSNIDASGKQIVFTAAKDGEPAKTGIWYYETGMQKAVLKTTLKTLKDEDGIALTDLSFSDNGKYIQLTIEKVGYVPGEANPDIAGLEVWNHKDLNLQVIQQKQMKRGQQYRALVNTESGLLVFMESDDKKLSQSQGDFAIVKKDYKALLGDRFWEMEGDANNDSNWVVNLKDGNAHLLPTRSEFIWFSPFSNYLVYFDADKGGHYFSYDLNTGAVKNISLNVPDYELEFTNRISDKKTGHGNLAAWVENDGNVLVYDNYDIWKLDLTGKKIAVNITNGFGVNNKTILKLFSTGRYYSEIPTVKANDELILRGFNSTSKKNGFYKKDGIKAGAPEELYSGNYFINENWDWYDANVSPATGLPPIKAKAANTWVVQRQSSNDAPNYYETKDFKSFNRLTDFQPQKKYQWFTEEVVSFRHLDGKIGQGILYKPENFDPHKKYPVIIPFYGAFSNNMFQFPNPSYIDEAMSPGKSPIWFLNNGYLVFTPDIAVTPLKYGPKAFSVIEGAVQYLKQLPYVDANKLGCGSHSWSAKLGAYLFTHSTSFGATAISEGFLYANPINEAFSEILEGATRLESAENNMEFGNLWDNKEAWLEQTTVLQADKTKSALLLFCNKNSTPGMQEQTLQLFNALRRLEKNVWWLKYDNGNHTLGDQNELKDYTIRYTQFFDHYLKNAPAPLWMTQGIPYKLKGIESRFELDPDGTCNAPNGEKCAICESWNKQYKKTPEMFKKEIKDWALDKDILEELERKQSEKRKQLDREGEMRTKEVLKMLNAGNQ